MPAAPEALAAWSAAIVSGQLTTHAKAGCCLAVVAGPFETLQLLQEAISAFSLVSKQFILLQFSLYSVFFLLLGYTLPLLHLPSSHRFLLPLGLLKQLGMGPEAASLQTQEVSSLPSLLTGVCGIQGNLALNLSGLSGWCCWEL